MKKPVTVHKKRRGRHATGREPAVTVRLPEALLANIERWAISQADQPPRSQAIRRLIEIALPLKTTARPGRRTRAKELARDAIEKMGDPTASPEERDQRRRRLIKGPLEFRDDRVDVPKTNRK
jgi:hypothetical protein